MITLAERIKEKMQEQSYSMLSLARAAGLKETAVKDIISGKSKNPGIQKIGKLADALKCSTDWLISGTENLSSLATGFKPKASFNSAEVREISEIVESTMLSFYGKEPYWKDVNALTEIVIDYAESTGEKNITMNYVRYIIDTRWEKQNERE